jgi:hypothetical protein
MRVPESRSGTVPLVSPTVLRVRGYRFYFYSREESRPHVHVRHSAGEAKFWLTPRVALAARSSLRPHQVAVARRLIKEHLDEIIAKWNEHLVD